MIQVNNVLKRYKHVEALKGISFEVKKGEILGFLGPNGAGKTTLMRILTGFFPPTSGEVLINGKDIEKETLAIQRSIGYLPENVPLYYEMRVQHFLQYVAAIKGVSRKDRPKEIERVVRECGLFDVERRQIKTLSKGYKQRVGLAQALIGNPDVIILDEPTTGLDPKQIIEIRSLIKNMAGNKTVILSTHILPEVSVICDRVIIINEGNIVAIDTPHNLEKRLKQGQDIVVLVKGDQHKVEDELFKIEGVTGIVVKECNEGVYEYVVSSKEGIDVRGTLAKNVAQKYELLELRMSRLSLEDIFVKLVTKENEIQEIK
ncbi:MAG: ATP-binding cassette domain-containing protein [Candidatus Omnitrophica bacterium]|nr:ATP-binding cassette domain-containing protein [Candidatus Omnitrophota bacterium]